MLSGLELTRTAPPHGTANPCLARFGRVLAPPSTPSMHSRRPPPPPAVCASAQARHARKTRQRACCWRAEWHVSTVGPQRRCVRGRVLAAHHQPDTLPMSGCKHTADHRRPHPQDQTKDMRHSACGNTRQAGCAGRSHPISAANRRMSPNIRGHQNVGHRRKVEYRETRGARDMPKQKRPPRPVPDDYICAACQEKGHWVYDCPQVSC